MTKEQLAAQLTGAEYPLRISAEIAEQAKAAGLVVVYGASDDLMEFEGAIYDEIGAYEGATAYIVDGKLWQGNGCDHHETGCVHAQAAEQAAKARGRKIEALWVVDGYSWVYKTDIPHATFEITEDGQPYCRGFVFDLKDCS